MFQNEIVFIFFYLFFSRSPYDYQIFLLLCLEQFQELSFFLLQKRSVYFLFTPSRNIYIKEKFFFNYNTFDVNLIDIFLLPLHVYTKR